MRPPLIGLTAAPDEAGERTGANPKYMQLLLDAGAVPIILPPAAGAEAVERLLAVLDGLLFTGGADVSPALYGEAPAYESVQADPARDKVETALLAAARARGLPLFGVCRGLQLINAALGGSLYQDLPAQLPSAVPHRQAPPYEKSVHPVTLMSDAPLARALSRDVLDVNSIHHQGVNRLAPGLAAMARAPDGLVEALYAPGPYFLQAVQWHPEYLGYADESVRKIIAPFLAAAAGFAR